MANQGEMMATYSKTDQTLVKEGGGRMNDKQRVASAEDRRMFYNLPTKLTTSSWPFLFCSS